MLSLFICFLAVIFKNLIALIHLEHLVLIHTGESVVRFFILLLKHGHLLHLHVVQLRLLFSHQLAINDVLLLLAIVIHFK
jgi:hypothetical protein